MESPKPGGKTKRRAGTPFVSRCPQPIGRVGLIKLFSIIDIAGECHAHPLGSLFDLRY